MTAPSLSAEESVIRVRRALVATLLAAAPVGLATVPAAAAGPTPGGPFVCGNQPIRLGGLTSNAELQAELERLARQHRGTVSLTQVGTSVEGRPLNLVRVGTGETTLMVVTQVHGDEPMGTEAALQLLREMAGNSPRAAELRSQLTLLVMPRTNPDGWERYQDPDFATGIDPRLNSNRQDLNRWFGPANPTAALVPETVAVERVVQQYRPDLVLDYHHQVTYETAAGDMATMSVLWATNPDVAPELAADGQRAAAIVGAALERNGHATVTLYPTSNTATTARNGLALEYGVATLLVEQRGQQEAGQKGSGALVREALTSMRAVAYALADGSFDDVDPADALDLPARGRQVDGACQQD